MTDPIRTPAGTPASTLKPAGPQALAGSWRLDPQASHARFVARTVGGLMRTRGAFGSLSGGLSLDHHTAAGALVIDAASIDTGNRLRDRHLRSGDFFNVDKYPELRYTVHAFTTHAPGTIRIDGELLVAGTRTPLALRASLRALTVDVIELGCGTQVDRIALGVRGARWMVPRTVQIDVAVTLRRGIIERREG